MNIRRRVARLEAAHRTGRVLFLCCVYVTEEGELLGFAHLHRNPQAEADLLAWLRDGSITREDMLFLWVLGPDYLTKAVEASAAPIIPPEAANAAALEVLKPYLYPGTTLHYHGGMGPYAPDFNAARDAKLRAARPAAKEATA